MTAGREAVRVDRFLAETFAGLSRSSATRLAKLGLVRVNGMPVRASEQVRTDDVVEVDLPEPVDLEPRAERILIHIVYEDQDMVVVDKPVGMVVHPAAGHHTGTLVHALLGLGGTWSTSGGGVRPGLVHRLDKDTSGLIVAARTDAAHQSLSRQLADRTMSRSYQAIARGNVNNPAGELEGPIGRDLGNLKRMAVVDGGRYARTRYEVLERLRGHCLLRCDLYTGRTHQIRVHLAAFGHPIAGDRLYGGGATPGRPMLHAWRLRLLHPTTGAELSFEAPPPADFSTFLESVR
ncbi:MAG: RluA family pseudouridine synthase [Candidatus Dormibacteraeota bacterium]|nr:RluA family pseudouridine synthase [Candidatus Dormibacteraeota bacterium]